MIVGAVLIAADIATYLYERIWIHAPTNGWQEAKDHLPYLVLGYLLIDWQHAWKVLGKVASTARSRLSGTHKSPGD